MTEEYFAFLEDIVSVAAAVQQSVAQYNTMAAQEITVLHSVTYYRICCALDKDPVDRCSLKETLQSMSLSYSLSMYYAWCSCTSGNAVPWYPQRYPFTTMQLILKILCYLQSVTRATDLWGGDSKATGCLLDQSSEFYTFGPFCKAVLLCSAHVGSPQDWLAAVKCALGNLSLEAANRRRFQVDMRQFLQEETLGQVVPLLEEASNLHASCLRNAANCNTTHASLTQAEVDQLMEHRDLLRKCNDSMMRVAYINDRANIKH